MRPLRNSLAQSQREPGIAAFSTHSGVHLRRTAREPGDLPGPAGPLRRSSVVKILIVTAAIATAATLAVADIAAAADFPHAQPVYQTASVGKMPIGKSPIGKSPIGKHPVAARY
jgi:hypothetical protein